MIFHWTNLFLKWPLDKDLCHVNQHQLVYEDREFLDLQSEWDDTLSIPNPQNPQTVLTLPKRNWLVLKNLTLQKKLNLTQLNIWYLNAQWEILRFINRCLIFLMRIMMATWHLWIWENASDSLGVTIQEENLFILRCLSSIPMMEDKLTLDSLSNFWKPSLTKKILRMTLSESLNLWMKMEKDILMNQIFSSWQNRWNKKLRFKKLEKQSPTLLLKEKLRSALGSLLNSLVEKTTTD